MCVGVDVYTGIHMYVHMYVCVLFRTLSLLLSLQPGCDVFALSLELSSSSISLPGGSSSAPPAADVELP